MQARSHHQTFEFSYSSFHKYVLLFGALMSVVLTVSASAQARDQGAFPVMGLVFLGFTAMSFYGFYCFSKRIQISGSHIMERNLLGSSRSLDAKEIASIRSRTLLGRIELIDKTCSPAFKIDYQIRGFLTILNWLRAQRPDLWKESRARSVFHRSAVVPVLIFVSGAILLALGVITLSDSPVSWASVFLIVVGIFSPLCLVAEVKTITLEPTSLLLKYPLRERRIDYNEITSVRLEQESSGHGSRTNVIAVYLESGKRLKLCGFKDGDIGLFVAIEERVGGKRALPCGGT